MLNRHERRLAAFALVKGSWGYKQRRPATAKW
jgi:hypothetical protein